MKILGRTGKEILCDVIKLIKSYITFEVVKIRLDLIDLKLR